MNEIVKKTPFWIFTSLVLLVALLLVSFQGTDKVKENDLNEEEKEKIGQITVDYINNVFLEGENSVELLKVSEGRDIYKVSVMFEGNEIDSYVSRDGKLFFPDAYDMEENFPKIFTEEDVKETEEQEEIMNNEIMEDYEEDSEKVEKENDLENFNNESDANQKKDMGSLIECLEYKNFVIYGADWCPYCRDVVDLFKNHEKVELVYIECTEKKDFCKEKNITAYPTIRVNNQPYQGERSLEAFAKATGCQEEYQF